MKDAAQQSSDWSEAPRPSFFGQLLTHGTRGDETPSRAVADSAREDVTWSEPLEPSPEADYERLLARERGAYVKARLDESFAVDFRDRQLFALVTTVAIAAACWRFVPAWELLLWGGARGMLAAMRIVMTWLHVHLHPHADETTQQSHHRRTMLLAALSGVVLGSSVLLFFGRLPIGLQYFCWMVLSVAVTLPLHSLALDPPRVRAFVNPLFVTVLACVFYRLFTVGPELSAEIGDRHYEHWFVLLPLAHWVLVLYVARRVQANAIKAFELQFYKQALINTHAEKQREAEEAVRTKNRFIATAAHDMRQPVVALALYAEHMLAHPQDRDAVVPKIARAASAVNRLFDSLFDLARMDNGQLQPRAEPVEIFEVLRDLRDQFEPIARSKQIQLRMRSVRQTLVTDPVLLRRMISNIIANAIKFTPAGKKVLIAARIWSSGLVIEVWDQGVGIAPDQLRNVFHEFYKVEGTEGHAEGFGLGLSIVARLAHALKIRVNVRSHPGRGTVFRLVVGHAPRLNRSR